MGRRLRVSSAGRRAPRRRSRVRAVRCRGITRRTPDDDRRSQRRVRPLPGHRGCRRSHPPDHGARLVDRWCRGVRALRQPARAGIDVQRVAMVDTYFPGGEEHLWSNRWWKYKSLTPAAIVDEASTTIQRRARKTAGKLGTRLLRFSGTDVPDAPERSSAGGVPLEAFAYRPTPERFPVVLYAATTTNPERTHVGWRTVAAVEVVSVEGRHRASNRSWGKIVSSTSPTTWPHVSKHHLDRRRQPIDRPATVQAVQRCATVTASDTITADDRSGDGAIDVGNGVCSCIKQARAGRDSGRRGHSRVRPPTSIGRNMTATVTSDRSALRASPRSIVTRSPSPAAAAARRPRGTSSGRVRCRSARHPCVCAAARRDRPSPHPCRATCRSARDPASAKSWPGSAIAVSTGTGRARRRAGRGDRSVRGRGGPGGPASRPATAAGEARPSSNRRGWGERSIGGAGDRGRRPKNRPTGGEARCCDHRCANGDLCGVGPKRASGRARPSIPTHETELAEHAGDGIRLVDRGDTNGDVVALSRCRRGRYVDHVAALGEPRSDLVDDAGDLRADRFAGGGGVRGERVAGSARPLDELLAGVASITAGSVVIVASTAVTAPSWRAR